MLAPALSPRTVTPSGPTAATRLTMVRGGQPGIGHGHDVAGAGPAGRQDQEPVARPQGRQHAVAHHLHPPDRRHAIARAAAVTTAGTTR